MVTGVISRDPTPQIRTNDFTAEDIIHTRSKRFFQAEGGWFFKTREGQDIGPFSDKCAAQLALVYFVDRTQWPDERQLREYLRAKDKH